MTNRKLLAAVVLATATGFAAAAMAAGPKPSSENAIAPDAAVLAMPSGPSAALLGPKASSENFIAPTPAAPTAGQPHYVWQEGYEGPGKWRGHRALVP
jgi:hypothetical protein